MKSSHDWLKKLVSFDTTSRNSNLPLIDYVDEWFLVHHSVTHRIYDTTGNKANLFATLPAHDGSVNGGIILSGHTDVVPVDGQTWETDPFAATKVGGRIYGRGTCDMKGFLAVALTLLPKLQHLKLPHPVHFALSYDEEVGCIGASSMIAELKKMGINPSACVVGEPTEMRPVTAHKGINLFRCRLHGRAAHSSLTIQGCNAIEHAAKLMSWIRELGKQLQQGAKDTFYDVPFSSITTNLISGGNAINTIPSMCEFFFEFRNLPTINPREITQKIQNYIQHELLPGMRQEYHEAKVELTSLAAVPGLEASEDAEVTKATRALTKEKDIFKVAYATEAGLFQQSGIPTIVCGPGSIEQAHRANEYITIEQLDQCEKFLFDLVKQTF